MNRRFPCNLWLPALLSLALGNFAVGETITPRQREFFENRIRPVLVKHCYGCHSAKAKDIGGGLLLDSRQGLRKGGQSGPTVMPGKPAASLLIQALKYDGLEMPPKEPLPKTVVSDFERWVEAGAKDPRAKETRGEAPPAAASKLDRRALWSFLPRVDPPLPNVNNARWARDPLDRFVLARLEGQGLSPVADADSGTLLRRLYFDLIGLPPSFEELESFAKSHRREGQAAVRRVVDRLLASPQFGETWGRHWLDVARYAESNGDDGLGRNATFPHAWRYRDYVIQSFNNDTPYDRFLTEQIAGDLLPAESAQQRNRQLVATGFLAIGSKPAAAMNKNFSMDIVADQVNVVSKAALGLSVACARCHDHKHDPIPTRDYYALAGFFTSSETLYGRAANEKLTAPATPLHELKSAWPAQSNASTNLAGPDFPDSYAEAIDRLEPVLQASLATLPDKLEVAAGAEFSPDHFGKVSGARLDGRLTVGGAAYSAAFWFKNDLKNTARPITAYLFSRAKLGDRALPGDHLGIGGTHDKSRTGKLFIFNGNAQKKSLGGSTLIRPSAWNHVVLVRDNNRVRVYLNGNPKPEIEGDLPPTFGDSREFRLASRSDGFAPLDGNLAYAAVFDRALTSDEAARLYAASGQSPPPRTLGFAMGVRDKAKPADSKINIGGESGRLGPSVPRGFLTAYDRLPTGDASRPLAAPPTIPRGESGRRELAAWLTRADHPQTARVMVNRVWLHLFGRGIVATPDDFGVYGARPTHPQLLDHLAERLVRGKWSLKRLVRTIVLSRTYQLASRGDSKLAEVDPENRLYARHARRRLSAEAIRDRMLLASGELDLRPGEGSAIDEIDRLINWPPGKATNLHRPSNHRSVYLCMLRHAPPPELAAFDLPDAIDVASQRNVTTLPTQSLYLMNNPFVVERAKALAGLAASHPAGDDAGRVRFIYRRVLARDPNQREMRLSLQFLHDSRRATAPGGAADGASRALAPWMSLCQALLMTNEFRYVD